MGQPCGSTDIASVARSGERVFRLTALLSLLCLAVGAVAQPYPAKPVRIVIPFPPGGGTDSIVRAFSARFAEVLGQSLVLDNRSGANGNVGTELVAKSPPDGYTLLKNGSGTLAIIPACTRDCPMTPCATLRPSA